MKKSIFLDRDGVLINNSKHYYIYQIKDIEFVDGVFENLSHLKKKGFEFFIVSNQGSIAKKEYAHDEVNIVHEYLQKELKKHGVTFKAICYCPHHGSIESCLCRKPSSLMLEKLIAQYDINPNQSYFIGDQESDMLAAQNAGIKSLKIDVNKNMKPFIQQLLR